MEDRGLRWTWHRFSDLTPETLYSILRLRSAIFVVEQNCVFPDMDGRDPECEHLCGWNEQKLLAYLRLVPPVTRSAEVALGRVVVAREARGLGLGRTAMLEGLRRCEERYPGRPVKVSAQRHLERFYTSLGFACMGEPYMEDGIAHINMIRGRRTEDGGLEKT